MGGVVSTLDGTTGMFALMANAVVMNLLQLAAYGVITPFSRDAFRRLNWYICYLSWAPLVAWGERTTRLVLHGNAQDWAQLSRDRALVLSNHIAGMDWLMMWAVTERTGGLPACKLCSRYTSPYLLTIFAEGTRKTAAKLKRSQEFAKSKGWKVLQNVLLPKTKGFTASVNALGDQLDSVFDVTLVSPPGLEPTLGSVLRGRLGELHILLNRIPFASIPRRDEAGLDAWLRQRWATKDERISGFLSSDAVQEEDATKRCAYIERYI
ncbi:1-acylglycerol-3-phosphate acyltransferase, putative [Perkinsus marinus ATCC 50983]|uniref:1-acylglycerol-3-phosphate acyltransferase, putative n=1 Tax=Perkinsus marinus (strain ATCC 50983 / TXsc) TaxID=423536 RepID=C5LNM7_PERM5|nr:1-acylglycerol-3-phosphate acyltransferase, putative [Perkinsus marinus ATCC 50983]EER01646.1 1-acylglycerol-3-phosphate acyltransferase, putative [Perkinsus marinus ATCC 50983]|eukprot:XP_002768928.1 1-acylglycerol-3-phosphate acyltransferase, putative [Perkinsus marinus ATCC 50983]